MIDHVATLYTLLAFALAGWTLTVVVALLAWRWRPPGEAKSLTYIERKVAEMFG